MLIGHVLAAVAAVVAQVWVDRRTDRVGTLAAAGLAAAIVGGLALVWLRLDESAENVPTAGLTTTGAGRPAPAALFQQHLALHRREHGDARIVAGHGEGLGDPARVGGEHRDAGRHRERAAHRA